ncbi:GNAT family N-acetyltransferase [Rhizobium sp. LEGMi135b]
MSSIITLSRVAVSDAALLDNLWQFYELESSAWSQVDIAETGRFTSLHDFLDRLGDPDSFDWAYLIRHQKTVVGFLLVGFQNLHGQSIMEFADLYVMPKYRSQGIATEVIRQTVLASDHPWLICVFRDDQQALSFWRSAFKRLPFFSVREVLPPGDPDLLEIVVNEPASGESVRRAGPPEGVLMP